MTTTRETIQGYFDALQRKEGWQSFLADDMTFTNFASPAKRASGKAAYLEATRRFYSMITSVQVRDVMVDGARACAETTYRLQPPNAASAFESDVAEVFLVKNGTIASLAIYFDSAPFAQARSP